MKNIFAKIVIKDIRRYFGFLLESGYRIIDIEYLPTGNWGVDIESARCKIQIYNDRNVINLSFIPLNGNMRTGISLRAIIYYLTNGNEVIGDLEGHYLTWSKKKQFERYEILLKRYIDQIEPYFGDEYEKYKDDLMIAQKKYNERLSFERRMDRKSGGNTFG